MESETSNIEEKDRGLRETSEREEKDKGLRETSNREEWDGDIVRVPREIAR